MACTMESRAARAFWAFFAPASSEFCVCVVSGAASINKASPNGKIPRIDRLPTTIGRKSASNATVPRLTLPQGAAWPQAESDCGWDRERRSVAAEDATLDRFKARNPSLQIARWRHGQHRSATIPLYSRQSMATDRSTHLDTILATTRASVAAAKARVPASELEQLAAAHQPRGWAAALRRQAGMVPAVIAEIKKASPSKGLIREDFCVEWLASRYQAGGAAALSVLTDEPYFQGSLLNLELASGAVQLPCLRKDFMVDEYQFAEARAHRADAILLIAAALTDAELRRFARTARGFELDVLVEVHTAEELDRVLSALGETGADAIGVNNRNLKTFEVSLETSLELVGRMPASVVRVTESGISNAEDLARLWAAGFGAFLIGESLMRQPDPGAALAELVAGAAVGR
jgi:indole-3-glycerol phosphate synthase